MVSVDESISRLGEIDTGSSLSESERLRLSNALVAALRRVQSPWDIACSHGWIELTTIFAIKSLIDAGVFTKWAEQGSKPLTANEFAELTGADAVLLARLLRHLAAQHLITEVDEDKYASTPWALSLGTDLALSSIYGTFYHEIQVPLAASMPSFLKEIGFKNPTDVKDGNFQRVHGKNSTFFDFVASSPLRNKDFANAMDCHARGNISPWPEVYDTRNLTDGAKLDRPLVVDVGGSKGHDLEKFLDRHSDVLEGSLVLQDLPHVLEGLAINPAITICPHDFFKPQPVKGARAYYFHIVLHDWPDVQASEILRLTAEAMEPGYSKILIHEDVVSVRDPSVQATVADMTMMMCFSSAERTDQDWQRLISGIPGLQVSKIWRKPYTIGGIIEVDRII
ncbi:O-methyltransferase [Stachybotrys elegans]|uniref:O-methyltransferase n=1 Tax=Stachybotrys elegans TaxID=80388 RepID=A0A8K0SIK3_9HYPO|nr:O-methyltransferase [Stachybotrys elegans]